MSSAPKARKYDTIFCPHCDRDVAKSTWYLHHRKFFNKTRGEWEKEVNVPCQRPNFNFDENRESDTSSSENDGNDNISDHSFMEDVDLQSDVGWI